MDISTTYMGLKLKSPIIVGSNDLTNSIDAIKEAEQYGAGAIVLKSLFEEQIITEDSNHINQDQMYFWYPEAMNYVRKFSIDNGIEAYLKHIDQAKKSVKIPIFASINCVTDEEWPKFAKKLESSGVDGIELNISIPPTSNHFSSNLIEDMYINIIKAVLSEVDIPVSVKVSFYFTNISRMLFKLSNTGIAGMVMFNRYFRPDIDIDNLNFITSNIMSSPSEITLALRWMALLSQQTPISLAGSTGVHDYSGIVKYILCGANAVQVCSILYQNKMKYIETLSKELQNWMKEHKYDKLDSFKGLMCRSVEQREGFERIQFMKKSTGQIG